MPPSGPRESAADLEPCTLDTAPTLKQFDDVYSMYT